MEFATQDSAIPEGSTVLVTGCNGFIGSHIADQFLQRGFRVRGTVRDASKNTWLANLFDAKYGTGQFELFQLPDMAAPGAFGEAVRGEYYPHTYPTPDENMPRCADSMRPPNAGVSAVAHSASIMTLAHDPNEVIPGAVAFALNALEAAYGEPSAKRFVFCSSSTAAVLSVTGRPGVVVTEATFNEDAVRAAWADPPYTPERAHAVYSASKTLAEQAVWKYHRDNGHRRPDMVVNTVLPNMTMGRSLDPVNQGYPSTAGMVALLYRGQVVDYHRGVPRQYFVDVQDVGRLHVAAAIVDSVRGRRIFAFAARYNWDAVLAVLRRLLADDPARLARLPADFSGGEDPNEIEPRPEAERLLRALGRPGWTSLEESVAGAVEGLRGLEAAQT
ncbi:hypothetical protein QBC46DRAFT_419726 [Diplogelasinospora grovesii]|uniref:NAD-dependent epimerase/dehydratase domain-containing protein n=1 Tax=Diplogelasinospora grovesii TaxID=303347 RepID=A0AAN6MZ95_9PEZI|nr:hypothetical protein QBC46DRAFT_419726 [Diplogelasinospora grovesii]